MSTADLAGTARAIVADGEGILAADEMVAAATLRCLRRQAPAAVPGIVVLSGGQDYFAATLHLSLITQHPEVNPWKLGFAYRHALQDEALTTWAGRKRKRAGGPTSLLQPRPARCRRRARTVFTRLGSRAGGGLRA